MVLLAWKAGLVLGGRLVSGGGVAGISLAAAASARHHEALAGLGKIVQALARLLVIDDRAHGDFHFRGLALMPGAVATLAVAAALAFMFWVIAQVQKRVLVWIGN